MRLPGSRNTDIVTNELDNEILIYDLKANKAYCLNRTSKIVYQACGDGLTFAELKRKHKFTDDLIYLALDELKENDLITGYESNHFAGLSRREVIRKVGFASMIALPVIASLVAPKAAHAVSLQVNGGQCTGNGVCQSGCCGASAPGPNNQICVDQGSKATGYCRGVCECVGGCCIGNSCQANSVATNQACTNSCQCPPLNSCNNSICQRVAA